MKKLVVLSLFDGIGCGRQVFKNLGVPITYLAAEIDKSAIKVAKANHPDIHHIGDVTKLSYDKGVLYNEYGYVYIGKIDFLLGGSPCQGFSSAGKQMGFDDPKSHLFWHFHRLLNEIKPEYFMLENVIPKKKEWEKTITSMLGTTPIRINSNLLTAQDRDRLYWCNFPVSQPIDKRILLTDVVGFKSAIPSDMGDIVSELSKWTKREFSVTIKNGRIRAHQNDVKKSGIGELGTLVNPMDKACTITATHVPKTYKTNPFEVYELNRRECEMLQGLPLGYTDAVKESTAKRLIGNGWTLPVIEHIIKSVITL